MYFNFKYGIDDVWEFLNIDTIKHFLINTIQNEIKV